MRFVADIFRRTRNKVGGDYPVLIRINGDEYIKGGLSLPDTQDMAIMLEEIGFDAINVTTGYFSSSEEGYIAQIMLSGSIPMSFPRGCFVHLGEGIKKQVNIPVIISGRINEPQLAELILQEGKADLIAIGRGLIADPGISQ